MNITLTCYIGICRSKEEGHLDEDLTVDKGNEPHRVVSNLQGRGMLVTGLPVSACNGVYRALLSG